MPFDISRLEARALTVLALLLAGALLAGSVL